jgi:DNA-directed RNA polymerase subunit M/transcription elongation factor TFIIS
MNGGGSGSGSAISGSSKKKSLKKHVDSANKSAADAMASAADTEKILKEIEEEEKEIEEEEKKNSSLADNQIMDHNSTKASREVLYIRYDDVNMKYVYVCVHCNTTWKTDNS